MKERIIFKLREFPHLSETFILAQIITALKLGYDVKLLVRKKLNFDASKQEILLKKYKIDKKIIIEDYKIPKNKMYRFLKCLLFLLINSNDIKYIYRFYKENKKFSLTWLFQFHFYKQFNNAAIFHIQYGTNKSPIDLLKKIGYFKPKVIVSFHGHDVFFPINGFIKNNGYYDDLFSTSTAIIANTPYLADLILNLGCSKDKILIIPVGVDTDFFYPLKVNKTQNSTLKLITVGRLDKVKGHQYSIEAVLKLIKNDSDVTLTIIGEGTEGKNLMNLIAKYHLEEKVFIKGSKSQEEVRQELWEHDIYLLTAVALKDGRRETQGLATLEAQACGLPVIVFDSGGVKYTLKDEVSGFVCEEYDVEAVVEKIIKLIEDPSSLTSMGKKAISFVNENYAQKILDKKWELMYRNLSNGKRTN